MPRTNALAISVAALIAASGLSSNAFAQAVTEYTIPTASSMPEQIVAGPDGALWFTEQSSNKIGRITTSGQFTEFPVTTANAGLGGIVAAPDGNLWFTEGNANNIGRITADGNGTVTEFAIPTASSKPATIAVGPHGGLYFTEQAGNNIGHVNLSTDAITEFAIPSAGANALSIAPGADGALWFTEAGTNKIGKFSTGTNTFNEYTNPDSAAAVRFITPTPDGKLLFTEANTDQISAIGLDGSFKGEASPPTGGSGLGYIGLGPDGAVWFTEQKANNIGRVSSNGFGSGTVVISEYPVTTASSVPLTLTAGPDGGLWFVEQSANKIGRLTVPTSSTPLVASILPESRSVASGNTATVFATVINAGSSSLTSCQVVPLTQVPVTLSYQTTNSATNAPTGMANTPFPLTANGVSGNVQSLVLALTTNSTFVPTDIALGFSCKGADPAVPVHGLNTLLLSSATTTPPDIIALGATTTGDGILHITGTSGAGAFAVATDNVGSDATITASVDTGAASLTLGLTICQTNPATAACLMTPASSVTLTDTAGQTPTFSIFGTASGAIAFSPAVNRVFVRFKDTGGAVRGTTSVAVETQ
jgi:virginiamycin B lyase